MLPIILDMKMLGVGIAGAGDGLRRKQALVGAAGPEEPALFEGRDPSDAELSTLRILFIAGIARDRAQRLADRARDHGILVNVEDVPELCDFHVPALVKRGDLLLTVSTGGRSPALSKALREELEQKFGPEWNDRLDELARLRDSWRASGMTAEEVSRRTRTMLSERGWL